MAALCRYLTKAEFCMYQRFFGRHLSCSLSRHHAVNASVAVEKNHELETPVDYPPIIPRYPPGQWGELSEKSAWYLHRLADDALSIPFVRERLESLAGSTNRLMWIVEPTDIRPKNIGYRQMLTKTHIAKGLPSIYSDADLNSQTDACFDKYKSSITQAIELEMEHHYKIRLQENIHGAIFVDREKYVVNRMLGAVLNTLSVQLAEEKQYLQRSQVDGRVRVETFWYRGGFRGEGNVALGKWSNIRTKDGSNAGIIQLQLRHKADWQLRTEEPLPQVSNLS